MIVEDGVSMSVCVRMSAFGPRVPLRRPPPAARAPGGPGPRVPVVCRVYVCICGGCLPSPPAACANAQARDTVATPT